MAGYMPTPPDTHAMDPSWYDAAYYENGIESGKSNYVQYRWVPDLTLPMADWLKRVLHMKDNDTVLDVGCAKGFLVKALRMRGINAHGFDTSTWVIENCDREVVNYVTNNEDILNDRWDHVVAKDIMEHVETEQLKTLLQKLAASARKTILMIVPLSWHPGGPYLRDEDNADPSHLHAYPLEWWMDLLRSVIPLQEGYITGSWWLPGLKPAAEAVPKSCGFIMFHRI